MRITHTVAAAAVGRVGRTRRVNYVDVNVLFPARVHGWHNTGVSELDEERVTMPPGRVMINSELGYSDE